MPVKKQKFMREFSSLTTMSSGLYHGYRPCVLLKLRLVMGPDVYLLQVLLGAGYSLVP